MDDRLDPRFAAALRSALVDQVRGAPDRVAAPAPRPGRRLRPVLAVGLAVVAVLAIALGGVVLGQRRSAPPAAPALPFDGDCAAILTSAAASDLVGTGVRLQEPASVLADPLGLPLATVGGLRCSWAGAQAPTDAVGLELTVTPAALRPSGRTDRSCFGSGGGDGTQQTCRVDLVAGGRWFSGFATGAIGGTEAQALGLVADLDDRLRALPAGTGEPIDRSGWWRRLDCDAVDARTHLAAVLDRPGLTTGPGNGGMTSAGLQAALTRTGYGNCLSLVDGGASYGFELHTYPGASAAITDALQDPGVRRLDDIRGARVYRVTAGPDRFTSLWVVAPGGVLQLTPSRADDVRTLLPAVAPLLRLLDADRRP